MLKVGHFKPLSSTTRSHFKYRYSLVSKRLIVEQRQFQSLTDTFDTYQEIEGYVEETNRSNWQFPLKSANESERPIVALGKFDAMHIGHRALAVTAAEMGTPWLLSFSNMSKYLGWGDRRKPLVPVIEKGVVLGKWSEHCSGKIPSMRYLPFEEIKGYSPYAFVKVLVEKLQVKGIIAGQNYRFGSGAKGNADTLRELGAEMGVKVNILKLVKNENLKNSIVSSTQVRAAVASGNVSALREYLGRPYRLVTNLSLLKNKLSDPTVIPNSCFLNEPPKEGTYEVRISAYDPGILSLGTGNFMMVGSPERIQVSISKEAIKMLISPVDPEYRNFCRRQGFIKIDF